MGKLSRYMCVAAFRRIHVGEEGRGCLFQVCGKGLYGEQQVSNRTSPFHSSYLRVHLTCLSVLHSGWVTALHPFH